ncbi:hypothetical protein Daus18300_000193 [Diaporthe australafricana]|uniref:Uncharacterized protein n=1 Tax=Diaporthe australafricana TaxID=127596 RepID=A0ABR3Y8H6_9PEZI
MFHGNGKREYVHKVYKVKITEDHLSQDTDLLKLFTPTAEASDNTAGVVAKVYPSTYPKEAATEGDDSSSGGASSGLSKGAIGGIVGGAAAVLLIFLAVAYFIVKRLKRTELAVQSRRETTSGSGTRNTEKKSATQVSITRVQPTPSEVDAMDCDPLMMSSSVASPRGPNQQHLRQGNGRSRSGSDALSLPSGYSSTAPGVRWNTPSVDSDGDSNSKEYFTLPPRVHNQPGGASGDMRRASEASSNYSYHRFAYARHGRNYSNASELSNGSDEPASRHGMGSPLIGPTAELSSDGGFVPELPGSDTETESSNGNNGRRPPARGGEPRRRSTGVVSPMSTTGGGVNKPPLTHANLARRRGSSLGSSVVSPMDGQNGNGAGGGGGGGARGRSDSSVLAPDQRLGSIDESATTTTTAGAPPPTNSMHGYFGSPTTAVGQTAAGTRANFASPPLPGFVSLGPAPLDQTEEDYEGNDEKGRQ